MRSHKAKVYLLVVVCVGIALLVARNRIALEYHKFALSCLEEKMSRSADDRSTFWDRAREGVGLAPRDELAALFRHQQWLVDMGYLARRDVPITRAPDFIPTNLLQTIKAGRFAMIYRGDLTNRLITVIAQPEQIGSITGWIHEHDR